MENIGNVISVLSLDWKNGLLGIAAIIIVAVWIIQKWEFLMEKFGIQTRRMRKDTQQEKDIAELKIHNTQTDQKIDKIFECMDEMKESVRKLSNQVEEIKNTEEETRRNTLRDRIGQSYRYYSQKKEWNMMEKEAFDGLVQSYEAAGGTNGFVHSICIPASMTWHIIDE